MFNFQRKSAIRIGYLMRFFVFGCLVSLLGACSTPAPMKPERAASLKRVGVVTLLPDALTYEKIGITVFNNESSSVPVGDVFNLAAWSGAEKAIKRPGREVIRLQVDIPKLAKKLRSGIIHFDSAAEFIEDDLLALVKQHRLDAVIVIAQAFDADNGVRGIRMFFHAGWGAIDAAVLMPAVGIVSVDERIKRLAYGCCDSPNISVTRPNGQPWQYKLEANLDPDTHAYLTRAVQEAIETHTERNIRSMGF